jgi:hypothetical protein
MYICMYVWFGLCYQVLLLMICFRYSTSTARLLTSSSLEIEGCYYCHLLHNSLLFFFFLFLLKVVVLGRLELGNRGALHLCATNTLMKLRRQWKG